MDAVSFTTEEVRIPDGKGTESKTVISASKTNKRAEDTTATFLIGEKSFKNVEAGEIRSVSDAANRGPLEA